jgi:hypothetical protein
MAMKKLTLPLITQDNIIAVVVAHLRGTEVLGFDNYKIYRDKKMVPGLKRAVMKSVNNRVNDLIVVPKKFKVGKKFITLHAALKKVQMDERLPCFVVGTASLVVKH